ncbi:hypothetical protein BKA58DRAFT_201328 [Alternaria rosae]|uniref:uncharacterized protein n=1 Tax=Alternaria rosae TaxID=1187941 RepID=UPI001E8EA73E|nr:uncharacterized protein BKA58DRAFT_201328 [Alternaria rosae]KAH6868815.1 hypothetical protein BKA58DRAFT_201328 [Alternaria rosae]
MLSERLGSSKLVPDQNIDGIWNTLLGAATALGAVAGNVTDLAALVALLAGGATATHLGTAVLGALARDVAGTTAAVAGLLSLGRGALAANVALLAAVVAGWGTLGGALGSAVRGVSAWTWSARVQSDAQQMQFRVRNGGLRA